MRKLALIASAVAVLVLFGALGGAAGRYPSWLVPAALSVLGVGLLAFRSLVRARARS